MAPSRGPGWPGTPIYEERNMPHAADYATTAVPVGAVLPYAGALSTEQLADMGWQVCDGRELKTAEDGPDYPLYKAIGITNGGDGVTTYFLPD